MDKFKIILFACSFILLAGCTKPKEKNKGDGGDGTEKGYIELIDYAYGTHPKQKMDVYIQKNSTPDMPLVIFIHGGGWIAGDKNDIAVNFAPPENVNIINMNYRLADGKTVCCDDIMNDIDAVLAKLREKSSEWKIRTSKIILWGNSAGGHLAMLYAYKYDQANAISSAIAFGSPTDFTDTQSMQTAEYDLGLLPIITCTPWDGKGEIPQAFKDYSPRFAQTFKPTFLIHGEKDPVVPLRQAQLMQQTLTEKGISNKLVVLTNGGHSGENAPQQEVDELFKQVYTWIANYSK